MQPPEGDRKGINLNIQGSTVTTARDTHFHVIQNQAPPKDAMEILKEHVAFGALFNSAERFDSPKCHPDTRKVVLATIDRWARGHDDSSNSTPILWLRGAAGAGKSAIAQTSSELWHKLGLLAASFYFSRTAPGRNNCGLFIPTLAYQLSLSIPSTWPHIERALLRDIGLFKKSLQTQLTALIIGPLAAVASTSRFGRHIIVIDGLDECSTELEGRGHEAQQREILEIISAYSEQADCPFRFLVASRPERQIRASFSRPPLTTSSRTIILDDTLNPNADIELFLNCSFEEIRHNHPYLDSSWPPDGTISTLIRKSSGHFIYASTAARHLKRPRQDPRVALEDILNLDTTTDARDSPFAELDALYMLIMHSVAPESLHVVLSIFELMCFRGKGLNSAIQVYADSNYMSLVSLERYLFLPLGSLTYTHLVDLHSILEIPSETTSRQPPIQFIHASFSEFLMNRSRSGSFCVERAAAGSRFLPIRLKHVFIQSLQPDFGHELGYIPIGFSYDLILGLRDDKPSPAQGFVEGLIALIGEDKEVFAGYVRSSANLAHFGVERNCQGLEDNFLSGHLMMSGNSGVAIILGFLKKHGIRNFKTFIEGYGLRGGEIVCPERRLNAHTGPPPTSVSSPSLNEQYVSLPSGFDAPPTPRDGHADELSATTQADMYNVNVPPPKSLRSNSKRRGCEVDSAPMPVAASGSQRITRSMAKAVANDASHSQMAKPVSMVKACTSGKKELKHAAADSGKKRRC